ncbi:uncharacterized protein M421DRAFT_88131 [Didymella exigua CBS 183.55]|uniref:Uncharacterized protein n=1 Tax=Didymella exigua CBS 183.55 TaxID=1150837 RepID=A0A6A5S437_9PLEO|nr:uncharacterized protein M421DRAFT_88131 [Didymella exigua CBS 183.55]KAF1934108.1 hypothetical protein M421DRAFT_88131 [Didymella exigua CBS 183.55]
MSDCDSHQELLNIPQEDEDLVTLYQHAVADASIGPKDYNEIYTRSSNPMPENSAKNTHEGTAPSQVIVDRYRPQNTQDSDDRSADDEPSDDNIGTLIVDDKDFDDLQMLRQFLIGSSAFVTLQTRVQNFVMPNASRAIMLGLQSPLKETERSTEAADVSRPVTKPPRTWQTWHQGLTLTIDMMGDDVFVIPHDRACQSVPPIKLPPIPYQCLLSLFTCQSGPHESSR